MSTLPMSPAGIEWGVTAALRSLRNDAANLNRNRLPTYPENDRCEFCGLNPWTKIAKKADGTYHLCGACAATCSDCGEVDGHDVKCPEFACEPEVADRPLVDYDLAAKDARL